MGAAILAALPATLVGVFYDDGIYAVLARSLAEGRGYRLLHLPGEPQAAHYPFLYPAFLSVLWRLWPAFPENVVLLKSANAALMGLFAALTVAHLGARLELGRWLTALLVVAACAAVPVMAVATVLFAEPLFLVSAAGACLVADRAREAEGRRGTLYALSAGLLAGAAALARSIGVCVVVGVTLALLFSGGRRRAAVAAGASVLLLAPWYVWVNVHESAVDPAMAANYGTYGQLMAQAGFSWLSPTGFLELGRPLAALALPGPEVARAVLAVPCLTLLLAGLVLLVRRSPPLGVTLATYLVVVAVWPYTPDRFLWAALPWLACAFALGVRAAWSVSGATGAWGRRSLRTAAVACGAAVAVAFSVQQARGHARGASTATQSGISATMEAVLPWISAATDSLSVVAGEDEALLWLYTGRRAVPSYLWKVRGRGSQSFGPDTLRAFLRRQGVTHLVLTGPGSHAAPTVDALLALDPGFLRMVRYWPGPLYAFEVARGGE